MSDIKRLNNIGLRFLQLILIILFSKIIGIEIQTTKIDFVDQILSYEYKYYICYILFDGFD